MAYSHIDLTGTDLLGSMILFMDLFYELTTNNICCLIIFSSAECLLVYTATAILLETTVEYFIEVLDMHRGF